MSLANAPKPSSAADMEMEDVHIAGRPGDTKTTLGAPASSPTAGAGEAGRGGERKMSLSVTYLTFFKSFVGLGVLALPGAFLEAGYLAGTVGLVAVGGISYYCMKTLVLCKDRAIATGVAPTHRPVTFGDLGMYAFGWRGRLLVDVSLVISQCGFATAYVQQVWRRDGYESENGL